MSHLLTLAACRRAVAREEAKRTEQEALDMVIRDNKRMRLAGGDLAAAAVRVIHDYDGLHRLSLAVAKWCEAVAAEGDRPHEERE